MNLEGIIGLLGSQNLEKLTSQIGGTEGQVKNGLEAALPAMLAALNKRRNRDIKSSVRKSDNKCCQCDIAVKRTGYKWKYENVANACTYCLRSIGTAKKGKQS